MTTLRVFSPTTIGALLFLVSFSCYALECDQLEEAREEAIHGDANAQYLVGNAYYFGQCTIQDLDAAMYWFFRASENGSDDANYSIGLAFNSGVGLMRNAKVATLFVSRAARNQHQMAIVTLANWRILGFENCDDIPKISKLLSDISDQEYLDYVEYDRLKDLQLACAE